MGTDRHAPEARQARLKVWDTLPRPLVTPSLLDCDYARVGDQMADLEAAGVQAYHLDVMDGHFVPNLSYGAPVAKDWRARSDRPFDTHLMMSNPEPYLSAFASAGCDILIVHIEVFPNPQEILKAIQGLGCRASLAINPPTPVDALLPYLGQLDAVLVMSVMPGRGGQAFNPSVLEKVRTIRKERPDLEISIDGGIKPNTAEEAVAAGVSQLVVGSFVLRQPDGNYAAALAELAEGTRRGSERGRAAAV